VQGEERQMGKAVGKDQVKGKATYPAHFGVENSRRQAEESIREALTHLTRFDRRANPLRAMATLILQRTN
jgi:geranylgeranyl diphosphate synthase, type II